MHTNTTTLALSVVIIFCAWVLVPSTFLVVRPGSRAATQAAMVQKGEEAHAESTEITQNTHPRA
jgi:hypothetical protein